MRLSKLFFGIGTFACLLFTLVSVQAQTQKGILSDGRDFYVAQLTPSLAACTQLNPYQSYWLLISSFYKCTITVSYFNQDGSETQGQNYVLQPKNGVQVALDQSYMNPKDFNGNPINPRGQAAEYTACHIHATAPISVSYYSTGPNSGSLYMALQTGALGKTYVVAAMPANPGYGKATGARANCPLDSSSSEFAVIAVEDHTTVTITPSGLTIPGNVGVNCGEGATGIQQPFVATLNRGQVYWVKSTKDDLANDLSGSVVKSDKPVAVIAGCESAFNGTSAASVLSDEQRNMSVEQMIPVDFWTDKDYIGMPTAQDPGIDPGDGSAGNQYKIFTYNPSTKVTVSITNISPYLNVSVDPFECPPLTYENVENGIDISSNNLPGADTGNKIMVEEYQYRQMSSGTANPSLTPEQMNIIPLSRFRTSYMFQVPDNKFYQRQRRFIGVIAQRTQLNHIFLIHNGSLSPSSLFALPSYGGNVSIPGHPELVGRIYEVEKGAYYAYGDSAFALYQFGDLGYDLDHDLGDNDGDDYFFSYMSTCGLSMGIDGAARPKMTVDTVCGSGWNLRVVDDNTLDRGISTIDILNDPDGVLKRKPGSDSGYSSQNVDFDPVNFTVIPGDTVISVPIKVDNPLLDAWAYVWVVNGAGNDTVIYLHYSAPKLTFLSDQAPNDDSINFFNSALGLDTCARMVFKDLDTSGKSFQILGYTFAVGSQGFRVSSTVPPLPATLGPRDSVIFNVCFNATQAAHVYKDTLIVQTDCPHALAPMLGTTQIGKINASDLDFGPVLIGHTACGTVRVWNTGSAPITLTKQWILDNVQYFTFTDSAKLPLVLDTGVANGVNLTFCYTPADTTGDSTQQHWGSDLPEPFTQINKDFSILKGRGLKPALSWDTALQHIVTECDTPRTFRSTLSDSGNTSINVDSLGIVGPDAAEYAIVGTQTGGQKFTLYPVESGSGKVTSQWVDVTFTPDLNKQLPDRWADRYDTLVAYDEDSIRPRVVLYAEVSHAEIHLSQSSVDLGMTKPGVPTQTKRIVVTDSGDAPLIIQSIAVDTPFSVVQPGSLKVGDTILPHYSDTLIIEGEMSWNGNDTGFVTITGITPHCTQNQFMATMATSNIQASALGANVIPTYVCMNNVDSVSSTAGSTSVPVKVVSAQIIDDPADPGGSVDFTFSSNNSRSIPNAGVTLNAGETQKFGVLFSPTVKQPEVADVIFTFDTASNPGIAPWRDTVKVTGTGIQEHTTISVDNPQTGAYVAYTNSTFQVPIQMTQSVADGADVKTITMDVAFSRDVFQALPAAVVGANGYSVVSWNLNQSADPAILHVVLSRNGNTPFDSTATLAYLQFQVMVAKDSLTNFVVSNVSFQNTAGTDLCYVLHDTIPGSFVAGEYCQNSMLRRFIRTGVVSFGIENVHPNPASNTVHLGLDVHEAGVPVTIQLYNSLGQLVRSYENAVPMPAGMQSMDLDLSDVPSGAYSLRVMSPDHCTARTIVVQK